jgi:hypothetical protein
MNWLALRAWLLERAQESSTLAGLVLAATTAAGQTLPADKAQAVSTLTAFIASAVAIGTKQR